MCLSSTLVLIVIIVILFNRRVALVIINTKLSHLVSSTSYGEVAIG